MCGEGRSDCCSQLDAPIMAGRCQLVMSGQHTPSLHAPCLHSSLPAPARHMPPTACMLPCPPPPPPPGPSPQTLDENLSPWLPINAAAKGINITKIKDIGGDPIFEDANRKRAVNGYIYCNLPPVAMKRGTKVSSARPAGRTRALALLAGAKKGKAHASKQASRACHITSCHHAALRQARLHSCCALLCPPSTPSATPRTTNHRIASHHIRRGLPLRCC